MSKGTVQVICGPGTGKTTAAIGKGISAVTRHKSVIMIQFLKGHQDPEIFDVLKRLEPEMKVFRFEKSTGFFETLSEEEKQEELINIRNGFCFAKKVLSTRECDVLILDEVLGILDQGIITLEEFKAFLHAREEDVEIILTGKVFPKKLEPYVDTISRIDNVKVDNKGQ